MKSRLKASESPAQAVRRVSREHVDRALALLAQAHRPEGVHEVRKEIKRLRAIFRLARGSLRPKAYRKLAKMMRLAAKPLAASRDARVTQKAFESLATAQTRPYPKLQTALKAYRVHASRSFANQDSAALTRFLLKRIRAQLADLEPAETGWAEIATGLKACYSRGRNACARARLKPDSDHLHEWRKQVKNLWYQLDFLCPAWPANTKQRLAGLAELGEQLGDEHDLELLECFARGQAELSRESALLRPLIIARRARFVARCRQLGARVYADRPALFCGQLERDWKAWRKRRAA